MRALHQQPAQVKLHDCALAQKACRNGYSTLYTRAQTLVPRSRNGARRLRSLLARLSRIDVLVIDDWVMAPLSELLGDLRGPLPGALHDSGNVVRLLPKIQSVVL